ncbi:G2/M phase-specific E3 ubiquitin-protein ligase-like [Limanda limanda]|uniref:G2/M phase-specific E3 ubiquitin-protein ligase-like n=1 Tax=Limanda limanda TaxID=27771 RepID=UPI0029C6FB31|nr:G2/M phase-specific E3 ubiquitin-protein ligase-like [Limanda limanda]XP_060944018.1 G2/M phase-specific E3 ubiquitin-protein ligase-like [Limanda limanda]
MSQNSFPPLSAAPAADETSQVAKENVVSDQVASTSSAISMVSFPPLSIAPVQDETAPLAESTQAQSVVANRALQEWQAIRAQQDQEYNDNLLVDQEKERKKLAYQACEERRQKAIEARHQRLSACEVPSDGVLIKFKYPDGHLNMRKFSLCEPIQTLFDFVGQDDGASEIFVVQEATSSRSIESSSAGSIMDHGIKPSSTLYVLWFSNHHVQEILSGQQNDGAHALNHTSPGQSSLSELSTPQSLSVPSLQSEPSTPQSLSVPSLQSEPSTPQSLSVPSLQSEPSTQPSLSVTSTHSLLFEPSLQPLPSENSIQPSLTLISQPQEILTDEEPSLPPSPVQEPIIDLDEQEETVSQTQSPVSTHHLRGPVDEIDLQTILKKLVSKVDDCFSPTSNQINVCRDNVLPCSLRAFKRKSFDPEARLDVVFVDEDDNGEGAVDEGGPTREYLRLLMRAVHQSNIFDGHEKDRQLRLDTQALQSKLYTWVGKMIAVCIIHGGVGPHFFSERLFRQICGIETTPATVDEVGDHTFREQLMKIQDATTVREANNAITEAADSLSIIGALRHVSSLEEKDSLVQSAADFFVNGRLATALDQFADGLKTLGLLKEMRENPAVFFNFFVNEEIPLQAKDLCKLFVPDFSAQGSNRRNRENMTICFWRDWLIDIEEGECSPVTLERVLEFSSGASVVPPLGFPHPPQIQFIHEENRIFPEANTCIVTLRLPLHSSYEWFKKHMMEGILQAPTFGLA